MELEIHQLDLRYQDLRRRDPKRERQLLASLAESLGLERSERRSYLELLLEGQVL